MRNKTIISLIIFLVFTSNAQYQNVKINNLNVSGEVSIAMNFNDPLQLVAGTHVAFPNNRSNMVYFFSTNGGLNWSGDTLRSTLGQPGSDPAVVADTYGNFYYLCIANWQYPPPPPPYLDKLLCIKSTDGGINWNNGTVLGQLYPKCNDMEMACIDHSQSQYRNNIYVTWTLFDSLNSQDPADSSYVYFCRSTNGGASFNDAIRISRVAGAGEWDLTTPEGPVPCTGKNGEVYVCYPYDQTVLFNKSADGGTTWLENEITVSAQPGGWLWKHSPVIASDISNSQFSGNVYICFSDLRSGANDRNIWFVSSTNSGNNWSTPVKVNDDTPGHHQEMPWICVDPVTGYIWIVFYDSRNYSINSTVDVYVARSTDGGSTFQNVKVSAAPASTNYYLGEYISITAFNNKVRPAWTAANAFGVSNIWTAIIDTFLIGIKPIGSNIPEKFFLHQNYPNPFNPVTKIKFDIPNPPSKGGRGDDYVKLNIYNSLGQHIETLVNESLSPGTYELEFDGSNYPGGVYFYRIAVHSDKSTAGDFIESKKMILLK